LLWLFAGPFVTIPLVLSAGAVAGPQNLIGYGMAGLLCVGDSYVWGELAKQMPQNGGDTPRSHCSLAPLTVLIVACRYRQALTCI
jgi:hypothetical protein